VSLLSGKRVLVTRPSQANDNLQELLAAQGAHPVLFPTVVIVPDADGLARLDRALERLSEFAWLVFTSKKAVDLFCERWKAGHAVGPLPAIAAIGPVTARALAENGLHVTAMPEEYTGDAIPSVMGDVREMKILVPRAQGAREDLIDLLAQKGALVEEVVLYQAVTSSPEPAAWAQLSKGVDYVTFTSASTVNSFFELLGERAHAVLAQAVTACIGPITADALAKYGIQAHVVARQYTAEGLVQAIMDNEQQLQQEAKA
jgi:uroporphyrinogen III methyltransferase / synthase